MKAASRKAGYTGVVSRMNIGRLIPRRLQALYFQVLEDFGYSDATPDQKTIIHQIGWTMCKINDVQDGGYLYGKRMSLPIDGDKVLSLQDCKDKLNELELLPALQRQLIGWITAFREGRKKAGSSDSHEISKALQAFTIDSGHNETD